MVDRSRRAFLCQVGCGLLVASVVPAWGRRASLSHWLGLADEHPLDFGAREPLVRLMQETAPDALLPLLVKRIRGGETLDSLVAAAALANARTFGGQDYEGFHAMMALAPSLGMAAQLPAKDAPLAVLKVIYRNTARMQRLGGRSHEVLQAVETDAVAGADAAQQLVLAAHRGELTAAESTLAGLTHQSPATAFREIQPLVRENLDVHQIVLAWRAWDLLRVTGPEHALTLLRTELHFVFNGEGDRIKRGRPEPDTRAGLPRVLARHHLEGVKPGERRADDGWISGLADTLVKSEGEAGADAVAEALAAGFNAADIGEALSLASTRLLLRDPGQANDSPGKPKGSVHGASIGLHASDSAHAWRNIASVVDPANAIASLVAAGWHTAGQGGRCNAEPLHLSARDAAAKVPAARLVDAVAESVSARDQRMAAALAERVTDAGALFARLLPSLLENDGALHHEKYFITQSDVVRTGRATWKPEHLAALARVAASGAGFAAPGVGAVRDLLAK